MTKQEAEERVDSDGSEILEELVERLLNPDVELKEQNKSQSHVHFESIEFGVGRCPLCRNVLLARMMCVVGKGWQPGFECQCTREKEKEKEKFDERPSETKASPATSSRKPGRGVRRIVNRKPRTEQS